MTGVTRRSLLSGMGLSLIATRVGARPSADVLPTLAMLNAEMRRITALLGSEARTQRLGLSREGRPIELISIGRGPRSLLIVGAPHANEPIGVLAVLRMMERLAHDRALRQERGFSFHFIPAIDIDGLAMNQRWFTLPRTPVHYLRHFFRPSFARQPEYAFPIDMPGYRFQASTPENICWQVALEHARPGLQCSLHGSDSNGIFHLLSQRRQALADALSGLASRFDLAVNRLGEPGLSTDSYAPGVLSSFRVRPMIEKDLIAGRDPHETWGAGQSSSEYAEARYGSLCLVSEVALWDDRRLYSARPSGKTMSDVIAEQLVSLREDKMLLERDKAETLLSNPSTEIDALDAAIDEVRNSIDGRIEMLIEQGRAADRALKLPERDLVQYEAGLSGMRTLAMLARRAHVSGAENWAVKLWAAVDQRIAAQNARSPLTPIPFATSAALQTAAVLAAAETLD